jgi:hypothetical protein
VTRITLAGCEEFPWSDVAVDGIKPLVSVSNWVEHQKRTEIRPTKHEVIDGIPHTGD